MFETKTVEGEFERMSGVIFFSGEEFLLRINTASLTLDFSLTYFKGEREDKYLGTYLFLPPKSCEKMIVDINGIKVKIVFLPYPMRWNKQIVNDLFKVKDLCNFSSTLVIQEDLQRVLNCIRSKDTIFSRLKLTVNEIRTQQTDDKILLVRDTFNTSKYPDLGSYYVFDCDDACPSLISALSGKVGAIFKLSDLRINEFSVPVCALINKNFGFNAKDVMMEDYYPVTKVWQLKKPMKLYDTREEALELYTSITTMDKEKAIEKLSELLFEVGGVKSKSIDGVRDSKQGDGKPPKAKSGRQRGGRQGKRVGDRVVTKTEMATVT